MHTVDKDSHGHLFCHRSHDQDTITSDPWRRHTNLCLQAEMDMITTDEGRHENGGSVVL